MSMKISTKHSAAVLLAATVIGSAIVTGTTAQAGVDNSNSLDILLPAFTPTASAKVLGQTVYTPNLTNGKVHFEYAVKGHEGTLQVVTRGNWCDTDPMRPTEILKLDLIGATGNVSAGAGVSGSTIDPTTGQVASFEEGTSGAASVPPVGNITILELCAS